jgi:signal transduction histidine kinase
LKGVKVIKSKFDLYVLINENIQLLKSVCVNKGITITHNLEREFSIVYDRNILSFVMRNLLANAVKFSHEGGEIKIIIDESNNNYNIDVTDQGVGMNESVLQSIFNPQTTVSTAGTTNESGTGIGLGLCREYLEKANGLLTARSEVGVGTTFTIQLPKEN